MTPRLYYWTVFAMGSWLLGGCAGTSPSSTTRDIKMPGPLPSLLLEYDQTVFHDIESRWDDLLGNRKMTGDEHGKVQIQFWEHPDGTVTRVEIRQNEVTESQAELCVESVKERAPFSPWPPAMLELVKKDHREITMIFNY